MLGLPSNLANVSAAVLVSQELEVARWVGGVELHPSTAVPLVLVQPPSWTAQDKYRRTRS